MILQSIVVGPVETNCYLLGDEGKGVCVLVDPGANAPALIKLVEDSGLQLQAFFLTHGHYDHRDALPALREAYPDLPVYIHERERLQPGLSERYFYGGPCRTWADGDIVPVGDLAVQVLETPVRGLAVLGSDLYYLSEADSLLYCASVADGTLIQAPEGVALTAIRRVGSELRYTTAVETEGTLSLQ